MSIESFFTLQTPVTAQGSNVGSNAASKDSAQGLSFIDFILGQVSKADKGLEPENHDPLQSDNPALEKNTKLNIKIKKVRKNKIKKIK